MTANAQTEPGCPALHWDTVTRRSASCARRRRTFEKFDRRFVIAHSKSRLAYRTVDTAALGQPTGPCFRRKEVSGFARRQSRQPGTRLRGNGVGGRDGRRAGWGIAAVEETPAAGPTQHRLPRRGTGDVPDADADVGGVVSVRPLLPRAARGIRMVGRARRGNRRPSVTCREWQPPRQALPEQQLTKGDRSHVEERQER